MKIKLFAIEADKEELYQLLKGNITDTSNKYYPECKDFDQHEFSYCMSGLVTKANENEEWAINLSHVKLWEDVMGVADMFEQRKFKEY